MPANNLVDSASRKASPIPFKVWLGLFALFVFEVLVITIAYDSGTVHNDIGWWRDILWYSPSLLRLLIVIAAVTLLLSGRQAWSVVREQALRIGSLASPRYLLVVHFVVYGLFVLLTSELLGGNIRTSSIPGALTIAWLLMGAATPATLALCGAPFCVWQLLVARCWLGMLAGGVLGSVIWGAGELSDQFWVPLGRSTFSTVSAILAHLIPNTVYNASEFRIATPGYEAIIAPACSGYQGIGLILSFLVLYLWLFRNHLRFPRALLVLPVGILVSWVLNIARLVCLILLGTYVSKDIADGGFHSQAGWLAFNAAALGLVALTHRSRFFAADPKGNANSVNPTSVYLLPYLAMIAIGMLTTALTPGFDYLYPLRFLIVGLVLLCYSQQYARWPWSWSWSAAFIGLVAFLIWMALEPAPAPGANDKFSERLWAMPEGAALGWLIFRVLGSTLTVPLAEELAFRGYLTRRLIVSEFEKLPPGDFTWTSFLLSAALFGILHPGRWQEGVAAGMLYAIALYRRGRICDAVLAHATTNGLIAVYVLITRSWSFWQ